MSRRVSAVALAAALYLSAPEAAAHAFGARYDLPLPLAFYLSAAGLAVAVSFGTALVFLRLGDGRAREVRIPVPPGLRRIVHVALAIIGVALLLVLLISAFSGPAEVTRNFATVFVWVIWWVGFLLTSALVIVLWPAVNPFRNLAWLICRVAGRKYDMAMRPLGRSAGWLAPIGLLCLAWIELVSDWSEDPLALGILICIYGGSTLAMTLVFGQAWLQTADPLSRTFELLGRLAMIRPAGSTVAVGLPGEGLLGDVRPLPGEVALVCVLIGVVLFDGLSETPAWAAVLDLVSGSRALRGTLLYLRDHGVDLLKTLQSLGLFVTVGIFLMTYYALSWATSRLTNGYVSPRVTASTFATSLLPIAAAYHLSHYTSYLLIAGQLAIPAASDPFGLGWDLFATASYTIDIGVIGARQIWWIAFAALIAGHSLAVLSAHRRAMKLFGNRRAAAFSQIPMTIAMIGLTVLSLWILSQPIIM